MKRVVAGALALLAIGACTACSPHGPTGTIVGQYRLEGGPYPGVNRPLPGTIWVFSGRPDIQQIRQAQAVAHVNTDDHGRFSLSLAPGEYSLMGAGGRSHSLTSYACGTPTFVRVTRSERTTVRLFCDVP